MGSWSIALARDDVEQAANLVLEGEIGFSYQDYIPGVEPLMSGVHWLFSNAPTVVRYDAIGRALMSSLSTISFWTHGDEIVASVGDKVRVSLVLHTNRAGYPTLMLCPSSEFAATKADSGLTLVTDCLDSSVLEAAGERIRNDEMPVRYMVFFSFRGTNRMQNYERSGDVSQVYKIWTKAWPTSQPNVTFKTIPVVSNGGVYYHEGKQWHYKIQFVPRIPPISGSTETVLAQTSRHAARLYTHPHGDQTTRHEATIYFSEERKWSAPGKLPVAGSGEHDFQSVLAHEIGHSLGLGHLNSNPNNVMFESKGPEKVLRTLMPPDIDFITNLYG